MGQNEREEALKAYEEWIEVLRYFIYTLPSRFVEAEKAGLTLDSVSLQPIFGMTLCRLLEHQSEEVQKRISGSTGISSSRIEEIAAGAEMDAVEIQKLTDICWIIAFSSMPRTC